MTATGDARFPAKESLADLSDEDLVALWREADNRVHSNSWIVQAWIMDVLYLRHPRILGVWRAMPDDVNLIDVYEKELCP